ncbi:MAG: hypothetical protein WCP86_00015 [bacterium]
MEQEEEAGSQDIKDTDIIFECPLCRKSLAIDYRAAGLSIPCTGCDKLVVVPIPEGMEISDLDTSADDQGAQVLHLRELLLDCQTRSRQLEAMVEESNERHEKHAQDKAETAQRFEQFSRDIDTISRAVDQIDTALASLVKSISELSNPAQ